MTATPTVTADQRHNYRPSAAQLHAAAALLGDDSLDAVIVPLVTPGKDFGVWTPGQPVVKPLGIFPIRITHADADYLAARAAANAVSADLLRTRHGLVGGTYGHAWIWRQTEYAPLMAELYLFTDGDEYVGYGVFEDAPVDPTH